MVDKPWDELKRLMEEESAEEARWLADGGSYLCEVHPKTHKPCRKCPTEIEKDSPPEENA